MELNNDAIVKQSKSAIKQWGTQWRKHAEIHKAMPMKTWNEFENIGIGKAVVCVANGWSLEREMETLKAKRANVDIMCCDKSLGPLIENGIFPDYVVVCDANVNYEKYLKPYEDKLQNSVLFINVCGNPEWTKNGNWKDIQFFVNMDVLGSEKEFMQISGCKNVMPAGTNVSNAMIILLTQCDNEAGRRNFFGYDKILLLGFDYCWAKDGNYYAYNRDGDGKANYMRHIYTRTIGGDLAYTSTNLAFSAMWLTKYIDTFKLPVVQCAKESIFMTRYMGVLSDHMDYSFRQEDSAKVREQTTRMGKLRAEIQSIRENLHKIALDHHRALARSF